MSMMMGIFADSLRSRPDFRFSGKSLLLNSSICDTCLVQLHLVSLSNMLLRNLCHHCVRRRWWLLGKLASDGICLVLRRAEAREGLQRLPYDRSAKESVCRLFSTSTVLNLISSFATSEFHIVCACLSETILPPRQFLTAEVEH